MEIQDEMDIEIFTILQKIRYLNKMIDMHINDQSEDIILNQYHSLKDKLLQQMANLISISTNMIVQIDV